jgi:hypothetical protein
MPDAATEPAELATKVGRRSVFLTIATPFQEPRENLGRGPHGAGPGGTPRSGMIARRPAEAARSASAAPIADIPVRAEAREAVQADDALREDREAAWKARGVLAWLRAVVRGVAIVHVL